MTRRPGHERLPSGRSATQWDQVSIPWRGVALGEDGAEPWDHFFNDVVVDVLELFTDSVPGCWPRFVERFTDPELGLHLHFCVRAGVLADEAQNLCAFVERPVSFERNPDISFVVRR